MDVNIVLQELRMELAETFLQRNDLELQDAVGLGAIETEEGRLVAE